MYKGFYHNTSLEKEYDNRECLGDQSYDALDVIVEAIKDFEDGHYMRSVMGVTAIIHFMEDNRNNCKFEQILLDVTTLCFVNDCGYWKVISNLSENWGEAIYSFSMFAATLISFLFDNNYSLEAEYILWYKIGNSMALFLDDLLSYRSVAGYEIDPIDEHRHEE